MVYLNLNLNPGSARKIALMCLHMHAKRSAGAENGRNNEGVRAGVADAQDLGGGDTKKNPGAEKHFFLITRLRM